MVEQIFDTLDQVQQLQGTQSDNRNFFRECVAGNKIGLLHVENIHPKVRDEKSIFITIDVEGLQYFFGGYIERNVLYFSKIAIPSSVFRESFLTIILIEIIKVVRHYRTKIVICNLEQDDYFKRISIPFCGAGFTRGRGTTGKFYSFIADYSRFLK